MIKRWGSSERKTRQVTLLFKPSVYEAIQKIAYIKETSVNNLIGKLMENCMNENQELIAQYDKMES